MNEDSWKFAEKLMSATYLKQAEDAIRTRKNSIRQLIQHKKWPESGWSDELIELFLSELALMDSNNFPSNCGLGEREGRILSTLVSRRHYRFGHGIGRSGDIKEVQPKAAGSSLMSLLTNSMLADVISQMGVHTKVKPILIPVATGMALVLCMLALKESRPNAKYVLWSRIDQKSCFKSISTAGFTPVVINTILENDELHTNIDEIKRKVGELKAENILCIMTTTSCFAPRACDSIGEVAEICSTFDIPHIINNAYGLQSTKCMHLIQTASRRGNVDAFVQSTDKNFLVPVGGSVISGFNAELIASISQLYPGRASATPTIDVFITLLSVGQSGFMELVKQQKQNYKYLCDQLKKVATRFDERVLSVPNNPISVGVTLNTIAPQDLTRFGSMLFLRNVSGSRVITCTDVKTINSIEFVGWGAHCPNYPSPYFTVAATLGLKKEEIDVFIKRLNVVFNKAVIKCD